MGRSNKFDYRAAIQMTLLAHPDGLSLDELVEHSGLKVDRSTLFRHLTRLIATGRAQRVGKARASRYRPLDPGRAAADPDPADPRHPATGQEPEALQYPLPDEAPGADAEPYPVDGAEAKNVPDWTPAHEAAVKKAVRTVVREWKRCNRLNLQIYLSLLVKPEQVNELVAVVEKELAGLHQDNLDSFGLTPAEFARYVPPAL
ncbi:MAG: hypothetical protein IH606_06405 [Burkholderiales bacterium]|nr:hypothetical protein [Burkholderiales bacterium]